MAAPTRVEIGPFLYSDPNFRGGKVCITGTGMSLYALVSLYHHGYADDELAAQYPDIAKDHIVGAMAYYLTNREIIDEEMRLEAEDEDRIYEEWKQEHRSRVS
jgi:uncharacterized protein (DUF433 family)